MELKEFMKYLYQRFQNGIQYKKVGEDLSQKNSKLNDGLHVGAKIQYNARSVFHSIR